MSISVFDLFKIGVGPSSSHTVGPMVAAADFYDTLASRYSIDKVSRIEVRLFGSLSATGAGHHTDRAIIMGLMGYRPDTIDPRIIEPTVNALRALDTLKLGGKKAITFEWQRDMLFLDECLDYHPNAMQISAFDSFGKDVYNNTYYSIGGGFIIDQLQVDHGQHALSHTDLPYQFDNAAQLLALCKKHNLRISQLMLENEKVWRSETEIRQGLINIWRAMKACIESGIAAQGILPGGLNVRRRAKELHNALTMASSPNIITTTFQAMDWVNLYALAVNEENAAGGRMVTAPTNGAAGIIPAVLMYYLSFNPLLDESSVVDFFLAATAVGVLCKKNASISGAEVGCQGEVGSACAMAAAGLCEVLGGTPAQVENAAEIGLEHNLGLTCDPVGGLVQVPCIERNAIAAVKAINATQMALRGDGAHFISLDKVIKTMWETGKDMQSKYKETSMGGLAVNATEC